MSGMLKKIRLNVKKNKHFLIKEQMFFSMEYVADLNGGIKEYLTSVN